MKKRILVLVSVLALVLSFAPSVFAGNDRGVTFYAEVSPAELTVSDSEQEVTVTVNANQVITVDGFALDLPYPEGWSIVSIRNNELEITEDDYVLKLKSGNIGRILWQEPESKSASTTNLCVVTYRIPANAPAGTYTLKACEFELTDGGGDIWEAGGMVTYDIVIRNAEGEAPPQEWHEDTPASGGSSGGNTGPSGGEEQGGGTRPSGGGEEQSGKTPSEDIKPADDTRPADDKNENGEKSDAPKADYTVYFVIGGILLLSLVIFLLLGRKKKDKENK